MNGDICRHGHAMTAANTGMRGGRPYCKPCNRIRAHADPRRCLEGHALTGANTYRTPKGFLKCRTCRDGIDATLFPRLTECSGQIAQNGGQILPNGGQTAVYVNLGGGLYAEIIVNITTNPPIQRWADRESPDTNPTIPTIPTPL